MSAEATSNFQRPAATFNSLPWSRVRAALEPHRSQSKAHAAIIRATVKNEEVEFLDSDGIKVALPIAKALAVRPDLRWGICRTAENLGLLSYLPIWTRIAWALVKVFGL